MRCNSVGTLADVIRLSERSWKSAPSGGNHMYIHVDFQRNKGS